MDNLANKPIERRLFLNKRGFSLAIPICPKFPILIPKGLFFIDIRGFTHAYDEANVLRLTLTFCPKSTKRSH